MQKLKNKEQKAKAKKSLVKQNSISSTSRLQNMLKETEAELEALAPRLVELQVFIDEAAQLKQEKQRLLSLKLSLQSILGQFQADAQVANAQVNCTVLAKPDNNALKNQANLFNEAQALEAAARVLKQPDSLNMHLYRAVVSAGGQATTQQLKDYLVAFNVRLPASGQSFDSVELTAVYARANYLVKKGLLTVASRGTFRTVAGWL